MIKLYLWFIVIVNTQKSLVFATNKERNLSKTVQSVYFKRKLIFPVLNEMKLLVLILWNSYVVESLNQSWALWGGIIPNLPFMFYILTLMIVIFEIRWTATLQTLHQLTSVQSPLSLRSGTRWENYLTSAVSGLILPTQSLEKTFHCHRITLIQNSVEK